MSPCLITNLKHHISAVSVGKLLSYGLIVRLITLAYSIFHDHCVDHIKFTDIDYHVFSNGSRAIIEGHSPYEDKEYRYPPIVALFFLPNVLINPLSGKLALIVADILCGYIQYTLNIYQGTHRLNSKLFLFLWLFNPVTIAISTRGSFEPILSLVLLALIYQLLNSAYVNAGILYGLSIHLKLYPIIYGLSLYMFIIQRRPILKTESRTLYWIKTFSPGHNHLKFLVSGGACLLLSSFISYYYYGYDYLEQSFFYHMKRKDLQHNFSVFFYLFRLLPDFHEHLSLVAFLLQFIGVAGISLTYSSIETNRRTKLRKLNFSLFSSTFLFVSLNKVCTSQYFCWYLTFLPLVADSLKLETNQIYSIISSWILSQANWLVFAYLYEYQKMDVLNQVGNSSVLFLISNLWILSCIFSGFDPNPRRQVDDDTKDQ